MQFTNRLELYEIRCLMKYVNQKMLFFEEKKKINLISPTSGKKKELKSLKGKN